MTPECANCGAPKYRPACGDFCVIATRLASAGSTPHLVAWDMIDGGAALRALAAQMGYSAGHIVHVLHGRRGATPAFRSALADALGWPESVLFASAA